MVPLAMRPAIAAIWAFDRAMAAIVSRARGGEAILAQLRLAWWRDEIAELSAQRTRPDPLLAALAEHVPKECHTALAAVVDAWEGLLAGHFGVTEAIAHATQRGTALWTLSIAILDGDDGGGEVWAASDLALNIDEEDIRRGLFAYAAQAPQGSSDAPQALRALDGWSRRVAARGGTSAPIRDQLFLLRMGMIGR